MGRKRKRKPIKVKEDEIRAWFKVCDTRIPAHKSALFRAARFLYHRQTQTEQASEVTHESNGVGLNQPDAPFVTWVAKTFDESTLPNNVAIKLKFRLAKYSRQLAELALDKSQKKR